ncbi:MAG TPA: fused MFS/spermidine synthase [bacterium]
MYQVLWVRSLSLVFGGSHLAVTTVLSIFMAGLAIGGYATGRIIDNKKKPLMVYGLLEIGVAIFAVIFMALIKCYPFIYIALAKNKDNSILYLSFIRVLFSVIALIIPAILMGGTLPALSRFVSHSPENLRNHLSFLYGINTLGAVFGAIAAGFFLPLFYTVSVNMKIAILINLLIGIVSLLLQNKTTTAPADERIPTEETAQSHANTSPGYRLGGKNPFQMKLVLWGIGISGFCALGYEVLWTRMLAIVVGGSVIGFTIMLVAFLTGIALGSAAYGLMPVALNTKNKGTTTSVFWFGVVQVIIGITAFLVTLYIRDLPLNAIRIQNYLHTTGLGIFRVRVISSFMLAFLYMVVPAFFMGLAFPLAGKIHAEYKRTVGRAVGEVLAYNTIGAILGAAVSGFALIYILGIERSLQILIIINLGLGLLVISSTKNKMALNWAISGITALMLFFFTIDRAHLRMWDTKYFAIYRNNQPEAFRTPEMIKEALNNTDVLYYAEGVEAIVSSIRVKGGDQAFLTNGRTEASSRLEGQQCQYTLGHLPMLLHKDPKKVLVVGLGSGMTLGATSVYPNVEKLTLVEIEPKVLGVARTFGEYNRHVLDNSKLKIIFNDGRNFLLTTKDKYDIITADPIHPWFRGAGYLYSAEYFKTASEHLNPGGIICQWLPIYELTPDDLRSVTKTFTENFKYAMMWLTHNDAELVGSNSPILIDEAEIGRRIAQPEISGDLKRVMMGSADEFLSYFVMGTEGLKAFSNSGIINTDDNLYLEFSAPFSIGMAHLMEDNVNAILKHRESIVPYLRQDSDVKNKQKAEKKWKIYTEAAKAASKAQAIFLGDKIKSPELKLLMEELNNKYPWFAPARFLKNEYMAELNKEPRLIQKAGFILMNKLGAKVLVEISAVFVPVSNDRASIVFVDNEAMVIYGQLDIPNPTPEEFIKHFADNVMLDILAVYRKEEKISPAQKGVFPPEEPTLKKIEKIISQKIQENAFHAKN